MATKKSTDPEYKPDVELMDRSAAVSLQTPHEARHGHWQKEKARLIATLADHLLQGRDSISLTEIKNSPFFLVRNAQNHNGEFLLATLYHHARQVIRQEKPLVLQSKRHFDLDDDDLRTQLRQLRDLLAERLTFNKDQLQAALSLGIRLQFDLIVQPRLAIENLIYPQSDKRRKDDILTILHGLSDDRPFLECVQSLLADHSQEIITKESFSELCRQAEAEVYGEHSVSSLITDLQAYENFCTRIDTSYGGRIDSQTALGMLHERGLGNLAETLQPELTRETSWSISEIEQILNQALVNTESSASVQAPDVTEPSSEYDLGEFVYEAAAEEEKPPTVSTVLDNRVVVEEQTSLAFQEEDGLPDDQGLISSTSERAFQKTAPEMTYDEDDSEDLQLVSRAQIEAQPPGPYPSVTQLIDEKNRRVFIKKIFQKDIDAYLDFVERLEGINTWKEAKAFLDREFQRRRINQYSKEAIRLSDLVFKRYFAKR